MTDAPAPMRVQTANALITGAPVDDEQLEAARLHFRVLEAALSISGPRFTNAQQQAALLHNKTLDRLRENALQRQQRAERQAERESGYLPIEVGR